MIVCAGCEAEIWTEAGVAVKRISMARRLVGVLLLVALALVAAPVKLAIGAPNEIDLRIDELDEIQKEIEELKRQLD